MGRRQKIGSPPPPHTCYTVAEHGNRGEHPMTAIPFALWTPGLQELLVILFIILLLFGAKRFPETMRSIGKGVKEFKKGMQEGEEEDDTDEKRPPSP